MLFLAKLHSLQTGAAVCGGRPLFPRPACRAHFSAALLGSGAGAERGGAVWGVCRWAGLEAPELVMSSHHFF